MTVWPDSPPTRTNPTKTHPRPYTSVRSKALICLCVFYVYMFGVFFFFCGDWFRVWSVFSMIGFVFGPYLV